MTSFVSKVGQRYDRVAEKYSRLWAPVIKPFAARIAERCSLAGTVADIGCGTGALVDVWKQAGATRVLGIDASEKMVRLADLHGVVGDAGLTPLRSDIADAAVSCFMLQHVAEPLQVIREMNRIVRAQGVIATVTWGADSTFTGEEEFTDILDSHEAEPNVAPPSYLDLVDTPAKVTSLFVEAGPEVRDAVAMRCHHRWSREALWVQLTTYGKLYDRLSSLAEHKQAEALSELRQRLAAMPDDRFMWAPEIIYCVGSVR